VNATLKEGLRAVLFMFVLTLVLITSVSALSLVTAERAERNANLFLQRAVMEVAGAPAPDAPATVAEWFARSVAADPASPSRFLVRDPESGAARVVVYRSHARGLWGLITAVVGIDAATGAFRQLRILEQNETPGLGARIEEPWFQRQTEGKRGPFTLMPEGTRSSNPSEIDAITGATVTSVAIRDMLNGVAREAAADKEAGK
jgi:Na+-transporting NADH:ubiquinone oxidoreductase subunit C